MSTYQFQFNVLTWVIMLSAFSVSLRSPNIRWLIGTLILIKSLDVVLYNIIIAWGYGYYFVISLFDASMIALIIYRQKTAHFIGRLVPKLLKRFVISSSLKYKLTANEVAIIGILVVSILINITSIIERMIRHYTEFSPMYVYTAFPMLKFAICVLMLLVMCSVAINGARNIYRDIN